MATAIMSKRERELRQQKLALVAEARALIERGEANGGLSADEEKRFGELMSQIDKINLDLAAGVADEGRSVPPVVEIMTPVTEERRQFEAYLRGKPFEARALSEGSSGGIYLAPEEFRAEVVQAIQAQAVMRRIARTITTSRDVLNVPKVLQGVTASWVAESAALAPVDPNIGQLAFTPHKLGVMTLTSSELLSDAAVDVMGLLTGLFGQAFAREEDKQFFTGDGNGKPAGILNDPDIPTVATASAGAVKLDDLLGLWYALPPQYRANASWVMSSQVEAVLRKEKDTTGAYILNPNPTQAAASTLMGRPIYSQEDMPGVASGAKVVIVGDFSYYYVVQRNAIEVARSTDRYFENDQVAFRALERVDGKVVLPDAFRILVVA